MFKALLSINPVYLSAFLFSIVILYFIALKASKDRRIRKTGGIRSPILGTNPLTSKSHHSPTPFFGETKSF